MFNLNEDTRIIFDEKQNLIFDNGKVCPKCKTSLGEFLRSGVVGCANCYKVFEVEIKDMIFRKQGAINHVGKVSSKHISKIKIKEKIKELEEQKNQAAENENYIVAEALKNQIEKLKGELDNERL